MLSTLSKQNLFDTCMIILDMANLEKLYQNIALQVIQRCHGGIKITKHGKILQVYDSKRHIWSKGLVGLIIKEECTNANLREWEIANVRNYIIKELLTKSNN